MEKIFVSNNPYLYYSVYTLPVAWLISVMLGGWWYMIIPFIFYGILPVLELTVGDEIVNPSSEDVKMLEQDVRYHLATWLWLPVQLLMLWYGATTMQGYSDSGTLTWFDIILLPIATGILTGAVGINISHELIHRDSTWERYIGHSLLLTVCYLHYYIQHIYGHHRQVGTYKDPSTAYRGENLFRFIIRSVVGSYLNACKLALDIWHNPYIELVTIYNFLTTVYLISVILSYGVSAFWFIVMQAVIAVCMLETINYIEHYGLVRNIGENVSKMHSWNTDKTTTNYITFRLQRHSDHHCHCKKRYQCLCNIDGSPMLPTGYSGCMILAFFCPLWFAVMDSKLDELNGRQKKMY